MKPVCWKRRFAVFAVVIGLYSLLVYAVFPLSWLVVNRFKENANWQAMQALKAGNLNEAIRIASSRIEAEEYDFAARRLLAQALIQTEQSSAAVALLLDSLDKAQSISRRITYNRGYNPATDYRLLNLALVKTNRNAFAQEMLRAGHDADLLYGTHIPGTVKPVDNPMASEEPQLTDLSLIDLTTVVCAEGATVTRSGSLNLARNSVCRISLNPLASKSKVLWLEVSGGKPMGFGSLLKVSINENEVIRVYADKKEPRWVAVPFVINSADTSMELTVQFLNDEFDPIAKADRNVEILRVGIADSDTRSVESQVETENK